MVALVALFAQLGQWQLGKAQVKEAAQDRLDAGRGDAPAAIGSALVDSPAALHLKPVQARGRYDAAGQILIDNRVHHDRVGYHVITPLVVDGSGTRVLVNRGWIAAPPTRDQRIAPPVPDGPVAVRGTAWLPSTRIFALASDAAPAGGNAVWQNLDLARYREAGRAALQPVVILLAADAADGFARDWPRPDDRHERHRSYALQWFGFAATALAIWLWFAVRRDPPHPARLPADTAPSPS